jgi:hypothetical protein
MAKYVRSAFRYPKKINPILCSILRKKKKKKQTNQPEGAIQVNKKMCTEALYHLISVILSIVDLVQHEKTLYICMLPYTTKRYI